ncbi:MAG: 50S ribosomal protein L18, partial [Halobacteria archaeon]|nr:50S ribosomal protein L18 [Halobacteria archaeon]
KPRLVARKSNSHATAQVVVAGSQGDHTVAAAHTSELEEFGWEAPTGNLPAAYLAGRLAGERAVEEGYDEAVLDIGLNHVTPGNKVFAVLLGAVDAGVEVPHSEDVLPSWERVRGEHIAEYDGIEYTNHGVDSDDLPEHFDEVLERMEDEV